MVSLTKPTESVMKSMVALIVLFHGSAQAFACGYHQPTPSFLNAPHPTTFVIAVALRKAADENRLTLIDPIQRANGYFHAVGKLEAFTQRLNRMTEDLSSESALPNLSIVFVDVTLWSRVVIRGGNCTLRPHVKSATTGDVIISTAESVLAAMLHGDLSVQEALSRGLIHIEGPDTKVIRVKQLIASSIRSTNRASSVPTKTVEQIFK